jgi:hypothetical protein
MVVPKEDMKAVSFSEKSQSIYLFNRVILSLEAPNIVYKNYVIKIMA